MLLLFKLVAAAVAEDESRSSIQSEVVEAAMLDRPRPFMDGGRDHNGCLASLLGIGPEVPPLQDDEMAISCSFVNNSLHSLISPMSKDILDVRTTTTVTDRIRPAIPAEAESTSE